MNSQQFLNNIRVYGKDKAIRFFPRSTRWLFLKEGNLYMAGVIERKYINRKK